MNAWTVTEVVCLIEGVATFVIGVNLALGQVRKREFDNFLMEVGAGAIQFHLASRMSNQFNSPYRHTQYGPVALPVKLMRYMYAGLMGFSLWTTLVLTLFMLKETKNSLPRTVGSGYKREGSISFWRRYVKGYINACC